MADHQPSLYWRDAAWYHRLDLPERGTVGNPVGDIWDFRPAGAAVAYLGGVNFDGKRVLEIGPASGFWTAEMERRGADVLALELAPDITWDVVPGKVAPETRTFGMWRLRNSWHQVKDALNLRAQIVYGHAEQPPTDRGRFDVSTFGCVLLHTRHPFTILERCAALTDETILVVDRHWPDLGNEPVMRLAPSVESGSFDTWWEFTPAYFERALRLLGFSTVTISYHEQIFRRDLRIPLFTLVARR